MKHRFIEYHIGDKRGWFRIFGYGLSCKHISHIVLFSERSGHAKYIKIGNYKFTYLRPFYVQ